METVDDIVKEFLVESYENLDQLDRDLMALEETPDDRERLSSVFRAIHTIKGTSGFLAYPTLEHVAHVGENLLVKLRADLPLVQYPDPPKNKGVRYRCVKAIKQAYERNPNANALLRVKNTQLSAALSRKQVLNAEEVGRLMRGEPLGKPTVSDLLRAEQDKRPPQPKINLNESDTIGRGPASLPSPA